MVKIIEYEDKYLEDVKDLLVELEEYIISIQEGLDYREKFSNNFMFVCFPENIE